MSIELTSAVASLVKARRLLERSAFMTSLGLKCSVATYRIKVIGIEPHWSI